MSAPNVSFGASGSGSQQAYGNIFNNITKNYHYLKVKLPSYLSRVVFYLEQNLNEGANTGQPSIQFYDIAQKIEYNHVVKYREVIDSYGNYGSIVDEIYEALDSQKPNSKRRFLANINDKYKLVLGQYQSKHRGKTVKEVLFAHADDIIDEVFHKLKGTFYESETDAEIMVEDLETCILIIVCKAFIDCKILENPVLNDLAS